MGFFSSVFDAIKSIFKKVLSAIAKVFGRVFGSPIVAALAIFVVAWMITGPAAFSLAEFMSSPVLFLTASPYLFAATVNLLFEVLYLVCPDFRMTMAKIFGALSFILLALGVWQFVTGGSLFVQSTFLYQHLGSFGLTIAEFEYWFAFVSMLNTGQFVSGLSCGPDSDYVSAWVDGFMAVPVAAGNVVDEGVDVLIDGVSSSVGSLLITLGACYLGFKMLTDTRQEVIVKGEGQLVSN